VGALSFNQPPLIENQHGSVVTYEPNNFNYIPSPNNSQMLGSNMNAFGNNQKSGTFNTGNQDEVNRMQEEQY
jgi:hypothetical protein